MLISLVAFLGCDFFENEQVADDPDPRCEESFFLVVDQMPILIGVLAELQQKTEYPQAAQDAGIEGRVTVQFIVSETGTVMCAQVIRGIGGSCDQAALKAVNQARFEPGTSKGVPVRVQYSLPIVFRLQAGD